MVDNPLWEICEREALGRARDTFGARADRGDVRCRLLPAENAAPMLAPLAPELEVDIMKASSRNLEDATRSLLFGSIIIALTLAALTPAVARMARH